MNAKSFRFTLVIFSAFMLAASHAGAVAYKFTELGSLGGGSSLVTAINNSGQMVGTSLNEESLPLAALWSNGTVSAISHPGTISWGNAINDQGQTAGAYLSSYGRFSSGSAFATCCVSGQMSMFGVSDTYASGINHAGVVVGNARAGDWAGPPLYPFPFYNNHAVRWEGSTATDLHPAGANQSYANAINDAGQIAGSVDGFAAIWNGTGVTKLGIGSAADINNAGLIAGVSGERAVIWDGLSMMDLGLGKADAINIRSQVVGSSGGIATLWDGSRTINLNQFFSTAARDAGWVLREAMDINDSGWIVANAYNTQTFANQAYLLSPVPEPATYLMLLVGLALIAAAAVVKNVDRGLFSRTLV